MSGVKPLIICDSSFAEPQAKVQPKVPWPEFNQRFGISVAPMKGTLPGVAGRNPAQNCMSLTPSRLGKICRAR